MQWGFGLGFNWQCARSSPVEPDVPLRLVGHETTDALRAMWIGTPPERVEWRINAGKLQGFYSYDLDVTSPEPPEPPNPYRTAISFGAKTAVGNAGVPVGVAGVSIISGNSAGHWALTTVDDQVWIAPSATGDVADLNAAPYTIGLSSGATLTLTIVAGETLDSFAELTARLQSAQTAFGDTFYLRQEGTWLKPGSQPFKQTITPAAYAGTFTPPAWESEWYQGRDLDTGNYVRVRAHSNETPVLKTCIEVKGGNPGIRFTGLEFFIETPGLITQQPGRGMLHLIGTNHIAADHCKFHGLPTPEYTGYERICGIAADSASGRNTTNICLHDNYFEDCLRSISLALVDGASIVGNGSRKCWADVYRFSVTDRLLFAWNLSTDKRRNLGSGEHPDFFQSYPTTYKGDLSDNWYIGNVCWPGDCPADQADAQGLFIMAPAAGYKHVRPVIVGNRMVLTYVNAIDLGGLGDNGAVDAFVCFNTVAHRPLTGDDVANAGISTNGASVGLVRGYNIKNGSVTGTDFSLSKYSGYDAVLEGGKAAMEAGTAELDLAEIVAFTDIKSGSTPDSASPKQGAHQAYIDYATRTLNLPIALPVVGG